MARSAQKGFVTVNARDVHYCRYGTGPALVMLHAAPCSAKVMAPLQVAWADDFTTFAFDLPGFGLSDAIQIDRLETHHLADAIAGAMRALGISQAGLYGRHTGAGVAVELARRHPELCSMVLTDGYPVFPAPYSEERLKTYLLPIEPRWDGTHLVWAWFRYREQHMFWPWDKSEIAHRADTDVPGIDFLYRGTVELLESGDNYPTVYASAFRHAGLAIIDEIKVPVCFGNRPGDSQFRTMKLYPASAWVQQFSRSHAEAAAQELEVLRLHAASGAVPHWKSRFGSGADTLRDYVPTEWGPAYVRGYCLTRPETPILLLHDLPGGCDLDTGHATSLASKAPVVSLDLFGNGNSVLAADIALSPALWASQTAQVLDALGITEVRICAVGTSALVATELARLRPDLVRAVVLRSPPAAAVQADMDAEQIPDISPQWDGGNFLRLWHHLRDQELWYPWYDRRVASAKKTAPRLDPEQLHRRAVTLLKQPNRYREIWKIVLAYPLSDALANLRGTARVVSHDQDTFAFAATRAANLLGTTPIRCGESTDVGAAILSCFAERQ